MTPNEEFQALVLSARKTIRAYDGQTEAGKKDSLDELLRVCGSIHEIILILEIEDARGKHAVSLIADITIQIGECLNNPKKWDSDWFLHRFGRLSAFHSIDLPHERNGN
jgi:hypothetical protein